MKTKRYFNNKRKRYFALGGGTDLSNIALGSGGVGGSVGMQGAGGIVNTLSGGQKLTSLVGLGSGGIGGMLGGGMGGVANGIANGLNTLMNPSGNSTGVGNALSAVGSLASNIPGIGGIIGAGVNMLGGIVNAAFGSNLNEEFIAQTEDATKQQANTQFSASDTAGLLSEWGSYRNMDKVSKSDVGTDGWFSNKASKKTRELNDAIEKANTRAASQFSNTAGQVNTNNFNLAASNYFSKGGGIHIKKKNRGKFTSYCGGKVTSECIARGKRSSSPTVRKRAIFAANARKWKHADGGPLLTQGGIWSNGVTFIDNGGTHEQNPYDGVQMGVDNQGIPNLVEQGEVVWNDYVFSNRLKPSKEMKRKNKYKGDTFADIAKEIQKESEERPNDWISRNGLEAGLSRLATLQEGIRQKREGNKFADGGKLNTYNLRFTPDNWELLPEDLEELRDIKLDSPKTDNTTDTVDTSWEYSPLRYAPIVGNGLAVLSDIFSKPDYNAANMIADVPVNPAITKYNPVGEYLTYRPLDRNYYTNQLRSNAAANRRAIMNTSGGNRAAALTGLLASDYNFGNQLGQLARQAEEYNQQLRERVEGFNRQTNLANAEMGLKASMANAESRNKATQLRLNQAGTVAAMRQAARDAYDTRRSHNLSAFLTDLGNLGREITDRNWLDSLAESGVLKINSKGEYVAGEKKHGGKLNKKKKGGWRYA